MSADSPSFRHWANHLMWLLPCLTGWAAYHHDKGALPSDRWETVTAEQPAIPTTARRTTANRPHASVSATLEAFRTAREAQRERIDHESASDLSTDELCAAILQAKQAGKGEREYRELASELGEKQGDAGIRWLLKNAPESRFPAMDGWKRADPKAALDYVLKSDMALPCTSQTLADLLDHVAEHDGEAALLAAVKQVRWELFDPAYPRYLYGSGSDSDEGVNRSLAISGDPAIQKIWLHSGALDEIAAQGERMDGFFTSYLEQEPAAALEDIAAHWPWKEDDTAAGTFGLWLTMQEWLEKVSKQDAARIENIILHASPAARAMVTLPDGDLDARAQFPRLFPSKPEHP